MQLAAVSAPTLAPAAAPALTPAPELPIRDAARQALPAKLPTPATLREMSPDDPALEQAFDNPYFDEIQFGGELTSDNDWPMDFIYSPHVSHVGSKDFLATVAAAARLSAKGDFGVAAIMQGKDGVYYLDDRLSAGFYGDGGGDWELSSGDLTAVSVDDRQIVAVVDADRWFDLRPGALQCSLRRNVRRSASHHARVSLARADASCAVAPRSLLVCPLRARTHTRARGELRQSTPYTRTR